MSKRDTIDYFDYLACIPVYRSIAEVDSAMRKAIRDEQETEEENEDNLYITLGDRDLSFCDTALAGLVSYLIENYPEPLRAMIYEILDLYCGKPLEEKRFRGES